MKIEKIRLQQMKQTLVKLLGRDGESNRDLCKRWQAKFNETRADNMISKEQKDCILAGMIDRLFFFEEAWIVYVKFVRFQTDPQNDTCFSHLIRLGVFLIDFVDLLSQAFEDT